MEIAADNKIPNPSLEIEARSVNLVECGFQRLDFVVPEIHSVDEMLLATLLIALHFHNAQLQSQNNRALFIQCHRFHMGSMADAKPRATPSVQFREDFLAWSLAWLAREVLGKKTS